MNYTQLKISEREVIREQLALGTKPAAIARLLGRHRSAITRELKRHGSGSQPYRAYEAQAAADRAAASRHCRRKLECNAVLWAVVLEKLNLRWSPEQISRYLKQTYPGDPAMQISDEAIYTYVYVFAKGELKRTFIRRLRRAHRKRAKHRKSASGQGRIVDMVSIDERPAEVTDRLVPGHWEGDLIMGKGNRSAVGTLVERTTRTLILVKLKDKDAAAVRRAFAREMKTLPVQLARSLTYDQGKEMAEHRLFTEETKIKVYFAHPHSPWERGTNENTNGLVRDFFPKGTDFSTVTTYRLKQVQQWLNERPRKTLGWSTPADAFARLCASAP
jgi:IS30 family transposase